MERAAGWAVEWRPCDACFTNASSPRSRGHGWLVSNRAWRRIDNHPHSMAVFADGKRVGTELQSFLIAFQRSGFINRRAGQTVNECEIDGVTRLFGKRVFHLNHAV